jgi:hypothetical protein
MIMQMKKIKVCEASCEQLDWMVAKCEGVPVWFGETVTQTRHTQTAIPAAVYLLDDGAAFEPTIDWAQGGPIIDEMEGLYIKGWLESRPNIKYEVRMNNHEGDFVAFGQTLLIAAMRCFIVSRLGDEVEVPVERNGNISS